MTPAAQDHLAKAQEHLLQAKIIADAQVPDAAAREAYVAAFHAAEAVIVEKTGKIAKIHSGVRSTFSRLAKATPELGGGRGSFPTEACRYKQICDYGVGDIPEILRQTLARRSRPPRFVASMARVMSGKAL